MHMFDRCVGLKYNKQWTGIINWETIFYDIYLFYISCNLKTIAFREFSLNILFIYF